METKTYNNQTLIAYLLGTLPESEVEMFDELSFTNDDFADELMAAEKDLVDAYLNGELSGDNLEQFKSYYLASPLRREKVEFAQAFQTFAEKELAQEIVDIEPESKTGFFASFFAIPRFSLQWGFALATLGLTFFGGWMLRDNSRLRSEMSQTQTNRDEILKRQSELAEREKRLQAELINQQTAKTETEKELAKIQTELKQLAQDLKKEQDQKRLLEKREVETQRAEVQKPSVPPNRQISIASFILSPSLRGNNQLPTLSVPPKTDFVALRLQLEADDFSTYRVVLKNLSANQTVQQTRVKSAKEGNNRILNLRFPAEWLKSNIYSLEVSGVKADGTSEIMGNYSFRVVR